MKYRIISFLLILAFIIIPVHSSGNPNPPQRPSVGLVLSGGGARGFAHIGVLKVLEENRVPVDYIGGASMGALIGAMYSMGNSPQEIEDFVSSLDWDELFQSSVDYENLPFRRKEDSQNLPGSISLIGTIKSLRLPNSITSSQKINLLFDRATLPYALIKDFDDMPIPFRAVGTDMVTGDSVVLKSGSLSRSLRATMSIPGVFAPVEVDGRILSDGGLVNNIPTDIVKDMGADILIVVNIETQPGGPETLDSLTGVLAQTIAIATADNSRRSLREADLIVAPDLEGYSTADFQKRHDIIELGYQEALNKATLLQGLSLEISEWEKHLADRQRREQPKETAVTEYIVVAGADSRDSQAIIDKLGDKYSMRPFDEAMQDQLDTDLLDLQGTGRFESLDYSLARLNERTGLLINSRPFDPGEGIPATLDIGIDVNSIRANQVNFNFISRLTLFDIGRYGAEWRNDLQLGSNPLLATEYFRPLGDTRFFISPRAAIEKRNFNYYENGANLAQYKGQSTLASLELGYSINSRSELRGGYTIGYQKFSRQIGDPFLSDGQGGFRKAGLSWRYYGINEAQIPTRGLGIEASLDYHFQSPDIEVDGGKFTQAKTEFSSFHPVSKKNTIFGFGGAGATFGNPATAVQKFPLGGRMNLGGYYHEEFRADNFLLGGIGMLHEFGFFSSSLGGSSYLGAWYEGGSAFDDIDLAIYRQSLSTGVIVETPFGPVFVGGSINEDGNSKFYFSFGRFY